MFKELNSRLNEGNAFHHTPQNLLSFRLVPENLKIAIYQTTVLPVVYGREGSCLTLREEHRPRVCENKFFLGGGVQIWICER